MVAARKPKARRAVEVDASLAQRDAAVAQLRDLLRLIDRRSYMTPEHQAIVAAADALVTESERW